MTNIDALKLIRSKNPFERIAGLTILSGTADKSEITLIISKLFDAHTLVRVAAAKALRGTKNHEAIKALYEAAKDASLEVRIACLESAPPINGNNDHKRLNKIAA